MEKQLEQLAALLVRQAEAAQRAQEESQRREERMNKLVEGLVSRQTHEDRTTTHSAGDSSSSNDTLDSSSTPARFPVTATTAPRLTSSASLREFDAWRHKFMGYVTLTKMSSLPLAEQRAAFLALLDDEWTRILRYGISVREDAKLDVVLDAMECYLRGQRNVIVDRRDFYSRIQEPGESFDDFLCAVKEIANFCDFCEECLDNRLRDRIVVGTSDEVALKRMLEDRKLTLQTAIDLCRASESANQCSAVIRGSASRTVNKVSNYKKTQKTSTKVKTGMCYRCGKDCRSDKQGCRAVNRNCSKCGKRGHFAVVCQSSVQASRREASKHPVNPPLKPSSVKRNCKTVYQLLGGVYTRRVTARPAPRVKVEATHPAGRDTVVWTPDSGAETTVMGLDTAHSLGISLSTLKPADDDIFAAGEQPLTCLGTFQSHLELGEKQTETTVTVIKEIKGALLSWYDSIALGILPENFPAQIRTIQHQPKQPCQEEKAAKPRSLSSASSAAELPSWPHAYDPTPSQRENHAKAIMKAFPRVFSASSSLREMEGGPMQIHLTNDARPFAVTAPRTIPYAWREDIKYQLDELLDKDIIEKVDYPTDWCHPIVPVPKKPSGVRLCVDLTRLNRYVRRPAYPVRSPHDAISSMGSAAWFTTLDAKMGYFQIKIAEEDQDLTCFITPWGRFKFKRAVMGLVSSGDEYNQRGDKALGDIPQTIKIVDDILAYDTTYKDHLSHVINIVHRCDQHGVTLNREKFKFGENMIDFCGYTISPLGYTSDARKTQAIADFPRPQNITDLRSFMGLTNQLGSFSPTVADAAQPLRDLLRPKNEWCWSQHHDDAFEQVKKCLVSPPVLAFFDPSLPTMLQTDASRLQGLGFVLLQKHGDDWKLVQCGSRFLSDTESRYAVIEVEMAAVLWAIRKCGTYLTGMPHFDLVVDHRPLVPILNSKMLGEIENARLQRMREKLTAYSFTARWQKGTAHCAPDALSRAPVQDAGTPGDAADSDGMDPLHAAVVSALHAVCEDGIRLAPLRDQTLEKIRAAAQRDAEYIDLRGVILAGFPEHRHELEPHLRAFWPVRSMLAVDDGFIVYGPRLLIPHSLRRETLENLHAGHQGIERTKRRARQTTYWPGMDRDIENLVSSCPQCRPLLPSQRNEPLWQDDDRPSRVFESVSADYFHVAGHTYLVYVDRMSGWPHVTACPRPASADNLVRALRSVFADTGVPVILRTDGGPQFTASTTRRFLARWGVEHRVSSPHNPRANGHAEAAVKAVKKLILTTTERGHLDNDEFARGLLEYRNTPRAEGRSPAQILFGHPMRSAVPAHHRAYAPEWQRAADECDLRAERLRNQAKQRHDTTARELPRLHLGGYADVQDHVSGQWNKVGVIVGVGRRRDYLVKMGSGRILWRNRKFLRPHRPLVGVKKSAPLNIPPRSPSREAAVPPLDSQLPPRRSGRNRRPPQRLQVRWDSNTYNDT